MKKDPIKVGKRKYWYFKTYIVCPPCGRERVYFERMYTPRPVNYADRFETIERWCGCGGY